MSNALTVVWFSCSSQLKASQKANQQQQQIVFFPNNLFSESNGTSNLMPSFSLRDLSLDVAEPAFEPSLAGTPGVELCECPAKYNASSCQDPSRGYYRLVEMGEGLFAQAEFACGRFVQVHDDSSNMFCFKLIFRQQVFAQRCRV